MRFLWSTAQKDLLRHLRDPMALVLWLGIPLLLGSLITLVFEGLAQAPPVPHLLVAFEDESAVPRLLTQAIDRLGSGQSLRVDKVEQGEGRARIGRGEASALLIIPAGFVEAVLNEEPTTLRLVTNPAQRILPNILKEGTEIVAELPFYGHRLIGPELREMVRGLPKGRRTVANEDVSRISVRINKTIDRLSKYLFPPVIQVETTTDSSQAGQKVSMVQLFLPGLLMMTLLFMAEGLSLDVWRERSQGTLRRAVCTPSATITLLGGKLLAAAIVLGGCSSVVLVIGMTYLGLPLIRLPVALVWVGPTGVAFLLFLMVVQLYASSQRAGSVLGSMIVMPLLFLGGSFFPLESMPGWMAAIGRWTPNGWAQVQLKNILLGREDVAALGAALLVLAIISVALFLITERRLRRGFAQS
jgi:ABC-type multidrug transport system permease subunit